MSKVLVGLSGGVDSAVCAARLLDAGENVEAFFMRLEAPTHPWPQTPQSQPHRDAQTVADFLKIPLHVWDLSREFNELVLDPFLETYRRGLTPNPCVRCNRLVKFGAVVTRARNAGFDYVATGHYAIRRDCEPPYCDLRRGADITKDQSYVLAGVKPELLRSALFPLGDVASKAETRAEAERRGLPVAHKRDSFDICFIPDGDTRGFLCRNLGATPGDIIDENHHVVGTHNGAFQYTIGQRRGLHIPRPHPDGQPRYVTGTDPETATVYVGPRRKLEVREIDVAALNWMADPALVGVAPGLETSIDGEPFMAQFRAHGTPLACTAIDFRANDTATIHLTVPTCAVAPGQSLVIYRDERVMLQGTICATR